MEQLGGRVEVAVQMQHICPSPFNKASQTRPDNRTALYKSCSKTQLSRCRDKKVCVITGIRVEQNRAGQDRAEQGGQNKAGQNRAGQNMAGQGRTGQGRAKWAYCCLRRVRLWWVMVWLALRRCRSWARRLFSPCSSTSSVCHPTQRRCSCRPSSPLPAISLVRLFTTASRGPGKDVCQSWLGSGFDIILYLLLYECMLNLAVRIYAQPGKDTGVFTTVGRFGPVSTACAAATLSAGCSADE